jgi:FkbM family methyltransferase
MLPTLKGAVKNGLSRLGYELVPKKVQKPFVPYVEPYSLSYRGAQFPCQFKFWIYNHSAEQWYKEWFYAAANPTWELDELAWLMSRGDKVLEIGCHHGFLTMMLAHIIGPEGFILALDANPENALVTQAQIALNGLADRCICLPCAVADEAKTMRFAWRTNSHAVKNDLEASSASYEVPAVTGDEMDSKYGPFNVLKIDVEGFEASVLRGCRKLLERRPKLLLELHPQFMTEYGYGDDVESVLETLDLMDYEGTVVERPHFDKSIPFSRQGVSRLEVSNLHLKVK